ncbi:MAG TPA: maleylpyruvate isomerase N-terminal domain-containing protein [Pyrinomonadaceae bacterium]
MKKTELQERVRESHHKLTEALDGLTEEQATRTGLNPKWSVKDALAHISAWEIEAARIVREIQEGTWKPQRLNQEMIDEFNRQAVESRREHSMPQVREEFDAAHSDMERLIEALPDEVDESTPAYKYIEAVTFKHLTHHAAQIAEYKKGVGG